NIKDVAHVSDKYRPQTNQVHAEGKKGALVSIYKLGKASTLDIVRRVKEAVPKIYPRLPNYKELKITPLFDQSVFVRASIMGVVKEAGIAAALTGLMIMLFLGSWRSTLIVMISIPLSILVSIITLSFLGETLNVMTLGGMALAVGILVDDATVEIENIHRNLHQRKRLVQAILDGASQIAVPAFVSTLCICIVFVPVAFITGPAKSLFVPLGMAVVFAMLTSYMLSHRAFNRQFEKFRRFYGGFLALALRHRVVTAVLFLLFVGASFLLFPKVGQDFFPAVDAGQIRLHVRVPPGTRLEETERYFARV